MRRATGWRRGGFRRNRQSRRLFGQRRPGGIQAVNGVAELARDNLLPFGSGNLRAVQFMHVKTVDGRASFRADARVGNVQLRFGQRLRDRVKQAQPILGLDFNDGARFRGLVVEADEVGDLLAGISLVKRA